MGVTTPCPGEIAKIDAEVKGIYAVGAVLGYVEASEADAARFVKNAPEPPTGEVAREVPGREEESAKASDANGSGSHFQVDETSLPQVAAGSHFQVDQSRSAARARRRERRGLSFATGAARMAELQLTQADLAAIAGKRKRRAGHDQGSGNISSADSKKQTAEDASAIRTGVADAMRRSWTRPLATVGVSVCLDPVLEDREEARSKTRPCSLCAARARACALAENPAAASRLIGGRAIRSESIDIGVAVEAQDGIMVPVIRNADKTSLADLTSRYTELVDLARRRRVTSEMTSGGIASVSNFGTFGLDWGTPIPLPDQTLLLGLGAGKKAPSWSEEKQQFVPDDASRTHAQLRSSQPRRRRRRASACKRVVELLGDAGKIVECAVSAQPVRCLRRSATTLIIWRR